MTDSCCSPTRATSATSHAAPAKTEGDAPRTGLVDLPGGHFLMGDDGPLANSFDGEGPVREVEVAPFRIAPACVTNAEFAAFVAATGHVTDAEQYGWSFVFHLLATPRAQEDSRTRRVVAAPWWLAVAGASWKSPHGPDSAVDDVPDHPVVHVSFNDAVAYCAWSGTRLPTEAEWEYAARGGLARATYPWGDDLTPEGTWRCNIWQGDFPRTNTQDDGHLGPAPVRTYPPNGYGLHEMVGNVWEWTADTWSTPDGMGTAPDAAGHRVRKGGSYLCHDSYCNRYRCSARDHSAPDDGTGNIGFRVAQS